MTSGAGRTGTAASACNSLYCWYGLVPVYRACSIALATCGSMSSTAMVPAPAAASCASRGQRSCSTMRCTGKACCTCCGCCTSSCRSAPQPTQTGRRSRRCSYLGSACRQRAVPGTVVTMVQHNLCRSSADTNIVCVATHRICIRERDEAAPHIQFKPREHIMHDLLSPTCFQDLRHLCCHAWRRHRHFLCQQWADTRRAGLAS